MDYAKAKTMLASARSKEAGKPIANNTRLFEVEGGIAVRLHNTDILTFAPDGRVTYNSGGWRTNTTKDRMNTFGPARIGAADGLWWIHHYGSGEVHHYLDGCSVKDGRVLAAGDDGTARDEIALRKSVLKYAAGYQAALLAGKVGLPAGGCCLFCQMERNPSAPRDGGHIRSHMDDRYYVPTLAWNALHTFGASHFDQGILHDMQSGKKMLAGSMGESCAKNIGKLIRRYVQRQLGLSS